MRLKEFIKYYFISQIDMKLHTCKSNTYKDSEDKILFFFIPEAKTFAQGEAQRIFVLSHTASQAYLDKEVKPGELEIIFQADYGYSIVTPFEGEEIEW